MTITEQKDDYEKNYLTVFTQRRSRVLLLLGFVSGLPLVLTASTLQAWLTVEHIDIKFH
ncbi:MAG: hypothetical protein ACL7BU_01255 [Candidatus Phlomobacter fragariae]